MSSQTDQVPGRLADGMPPVVLGVVLFVASECVFFSALFAAWFTARARSPQWPPGGIQIDPSLGVFTSALLVLSSVVVAFAEYALRRQDTAGMRRLLWLAVVLGLVAVLGQGIHLGGLPFTISSNGFGTIYWTTSAIDSAHVLGAVVFALVVLARSAAGRLMPSLMRGAAVFWHFVVGVSVFTFLVLEVLT
ncbi:MAG: cytochrome c oxidase subunit 3 [Nocardiopsaceae bacterium]|jgi:cytochrome c oxidase subunit 3|nr:cytochrome c oxidase subunit 3 [Nocardiopsaceae bacterium]